MVYVVLLSPNVWDSFIMAKTKQENPKWQCPICGDIRYETVKTEARRMVGESGQLNYKGIQHACRGCSVLFRNPHLFNKGRIE